MNNVGYIPYVEVAVIGLLATGIGTVGSRRIDRAIKLIGVQGLFLTGLVILMGYVSHDKPLYLVAALTLLVKGLAAPAVLLYVLKRVFNKLEGEMFVGRTVSLVVACGLVALAYHVTVPLINNGAARDLLSVALSLILLGLFVMVTRRTALMQVLGFLLMENGVFVTTTVAGIPLVVELGVFFDVLMGVIIMAVLSHRINTVFAGIEITRLNSLKG